MSSEQTAAPADEQSPKPPAMVAGGAIRPIVPQDLESAWRIATAVVRAGMAPKGLDTVERCMIAIMHGLEVGMTPMNALQSICVINGRPTIYGDGAIGLVRGSGLLEWIEETIDHTEAGPVATCRAKRRNDAIVIERSFSQADAKQAGLWGKQGPWQGYPERMLQMRARAFTLRDGFADVLKGLGIKEEVEDIPVRDSTPARPARPRVVEMPPDPEVARVPAKPRDIRVDVNGYNQDTVWQDETVHPGEMPDIPPAFDRRASANGAAR